MVMKLVACDGGVNAEMPCQVCMMTKERVRGLVV